MEREIIFRGKRIDQREWSEGSLLSINGNSYIYKGSFGDLEDIDFGYGFQIVSNETLGQYTCLKDCSGNRIFEGDILEFEDLGEEGYEYKEGFDFINTASVVFNNGRFELENFWSGNSGVLEEMNNDHEEFISIFAYSKIIGNIHDNPELLEVQGWK